MEVIGWEDVDRLVKGDDYGKWDAKVEPGDLEFVESNGATTLLVKDRPVKLSPWAETQMCNRLGIPTRYWHRCPDSLKRRQFDHWKHEEKAWLMRMKNSMVRGILSHSYEPFDNAKLIEMWATAGKPWDFEYQPLLSDESFLLRATVGEVSHRPLGGLKIGVMVTNSEVGRRAVSVNASIWRVICSNGMIVTYGGRAIMYKRHIFIDQAALEERFAQATMEAMEESQKALERFVATNDVPADEEKLLALVEPLGQTEAFRDRAVDSFRAVRENTMFAVLNAMTNAARDLPQDDRFDVEAHVGSLLAKAA